MTPPRLVAITVRLPEEWVQNLEALVDPDHGLEDVAAVLAELADHAQQGVYRPGSWERGWLCQALGYEWLKRLEPDPEHPDIFERPRQRTTIEGHAATSSETGPADAGKQEGQLDPLAPAPTVGGKPRLSTTRTPGVLMDQRGRMWLVDDARLPHSNREGDVCDGCGGQLGDVAYLEHRLDGATRCAACVEVG